MESAKKWKIKDSDGIPYLTRLQIGGTYFVTTNIDVSDGLFNGATGTIQKIEMGKNSQGVLVPTIVWIQFDDPETGAKQRRKYSYKYQSEAYQTTWTPIERISRTLSISYVYPGMEINRNQLPLLAANARTIAKSQGSTIPAVVVSFRGRLSREDKYVACSRATSINGLFIDGKFVPPESPGTTDCVGEEMKKLMLVPVEFSLRFFKDVLSENKLYYHNVEYFPKYSKDVISDPHIMSSDIIALVEPHILEFDSVEIPGFNCIVRKDCPAGRRNSQGVLLYIKHDRKVYAK